MITPATYNNLPFFAGDTFTLNMSWKDDLGVLFDLTGYHGDLRFVTSPVEDLVVLAVNETTGIQLGSVAPNIRIIISKTVTSTIEIAPLYYILELTDLSNVKSRLLQGTVKYKDLCDT